MISHSIAPKYFWERKDGWTGKEKHKRINGRERRNPHHSEMGRKSKGSYSERS